MVVCRIWEVIIYKFYPMRIMRCHGGGTGLFFYYFSVVAEITWLSKVLF